jgi:8-oxo-dGTP diphosphatase
VRLGKEVQTLPRRTGFRRVIEPVVANSVTHVVAGALFDADGRVLIAQRPPGKHMAGEWEFPGGKVSSGETVVAALTRELKEELDVRVLFAERVIAYEHRYVDRTVLLDLWRVFRFEGTPKPLEGQAINWVPLDALDSCGLLEADRPMIPALRKLFTPRT